MTRRSGAPDMIQRSPFARYLGVEIELNGTGRTFRLDDRDEIVGNALIPALHGGAVAAFLELCCAAELARTMGIQLPPRPISINLQYIASAKRIPTFASAKVRRVGRRVAVVHGEAWQEDRNAPVCAAQCEFRVWSET